ncbi:MAG: hypothetical protein ACK4QW_11460 [Alphaproteobacteria bacterium]
MVARVLGTLVANGRTVRRVMYGVLALLVVLDLLIPSGYGRFPWEGLGGFGAFYGFVACALIIGIAKALGYALLYRSENYYDD